MHVMFYELPVRSKKVFCCCWSSTQLILVFFKVSNLILKQVYKNCLSSNITSYDQEFRGGMFFFHQFALRVCLVF